MVYQKILLSKIVFKFGVEHETPYKIGVSIRHLLVIYHVRKWDPIFEIYKTEF